MFAKNLFKSIRLLLSLTILLYQDFVWSDVAPLQPSETDVSSSNLDRYSRQLAARKIYEENNFRDLIRRKRNAAAADDDASDYKSRDSDDDYSGTNNGVARRRWNKSSLNVWGKRKYDDEFIGTNKRKWGLKSMNVWGKRALGKSPDYQNYEDGDESVGTYPYLMSDRRETPIEREPLYVDRNPQDEVESHLIKKKSYPWKNLPAHLTKPREDKKRKWGENTMNVWG